MIEIRHKDTGQVLRQVPGGTLLGVRLRRLSLPSADLGSADLRGACLARADLAGADLQGASLVQARGASQIHWIFSHWGYGLAALTPLWMLFVLTLSPGLSAGLLLDSLPMFLMFGGMVGAFRACCCADDVRRGSTVNLCGANLSSADLTAACLTGAPMEGACLQGADLVGARLRGADLRGADLQSANVLRADLQGARLQGTKLQSTHMAEANLRFANLQRADLRGADLRQADLRVADLQGADLRGADLRASLGGAKLAGARYDETTRWPGSFQPSRYGAVTDAEVVPALLPQGRGDEPSPSPLPPIAPGGQA